MRLHKVISNIQAEHLQLGPYRLAKVVHIKAIDTLRTEEIDALVVESDSMLHELMINDKWYLTPIFYLGQTSRVCDGEISDFGDASIARRLQILIPATTPFTDLPLPTEQDKRLACKILRYLISRKLTLMPRNNRASKIGYSFPLIEDMSLEKNPIHYIKALNQLADQDYFARKPIDKVNICYDCNGSYLNFSECCTKCNSLDLKSEQLVHHFRCAFVGPQSDFIKDEKLICPKCDHQLKHIGIDYDKPSEIHKCMSCNHSSQETKMKAKCVDCRKENQLDQLITIGIDEYIPSEKGRTFAHQRTTRTDFGSLDQKKKSDLIPLPAFNLIRSHEAKKPKNENDATFEMLITLDPELLSSLNSGLQNSLLEELSSIIKPYLRYNDLLSIGEHKRIHALLIDYGNQAKEEIIDILHYNLNKLLRDNGWAQHDILSITAEALRP